MTELAAAKAMQNRLRDAWEAPSGAEAVVGYVPPIRWPFTPVPEANGSYSVDFVSRVASSRQTTMSRPARWETIGELRITIGALRADKEAGNILRSLGKIVRDAYAHQSDDLAGVTYRAVSEPMPQPAMRDQTTVLVTVVYVFTDYRG